MYEEAHQLPWVFRLGIWPWLPGIMWSGSNTILRTDSRTLNIGNSESSQSIEDGNCTTHGPRVLAAYGGVIRGSQRVRETAAACLVNIVQSAQQVNSISVIGHSVELSQRYMRNTDYIHGIPTRNDIKGRTKPGEYTQDLPARFPSYQILFSLLFGSQSSTHPRLLIGKIELERT